MGRCLPAGMSTRGQNENGWTEWRPRQTMEVVKRSKAYRRSYGDLQAKDQARPHAEVHRSDVAPCADSLRLPSADAR